VAVIGVGNVPSNYCLQDCVRVYEGVVWKLSCRRLWGVRGAPPVRCVPDLQHSSHSRDSSHTSFTATRTTTATVPYGKLVYTADIFVVLYTYISLSSRLSSATVACSSPFSLSRCTRLRFRALSKTAEKDTGQGANGPPSFRRLSEGTEGQTEGPQGPENSAEGFISFILGDT
jgi:hypothetical protein